jgi:hypothetical protein
MSKLALIRFASVLTGAAVLFGLQQGLKTSFYIALPAGMGAYLAVKVGLGLLFGVEADQK